MSEKNELYTYFMLAEFSEAPDEITSRLGLQPTECCVKGDATLDSGRVRKFNSWTLESRLPRTSDFEMHIADVLEQLDANKEGVKQTIKAHGWGCMQLVGYFNSHYPGLSLSADLVHRIAEYGLSIDCDFYYLFEDTTE